MANNTLFVKIKTDLKEFSTGLQNMERQLKTFSKKTEAIGRTLTTGLTLPVVALGAYGIKTASQLEQAGVAFTVMLKSAEKAKILIGELTEFSAKTPFEFNEIQNAGKKLLAFGISASDIKTKLENIGNAAMGNSEVFERLTDAYGKVKAKGKASMEELNRFAEAGVPILQSLADMYGVTTAEVIKMSSQGKISFADIDNALTRMTTGSGQFAGMMEQQSKTLAGLWSTVKDNIGLALASIMQVAIPAIKSLTEKVSAIAEKFRNLSPETQSFILKIALLTASIGPLLLIVSKSVQVFLALKTALTLMTGPIGIAIVAIGLLVVAVRAIIKNWDGISAFFQKLWLKVSILFLDGIRSILQSIQFFTKYIGIDFNGAIDKLSTKINESSNKLKTLGKSTKEVKTKVEETVTPVKTLTTGLKDLGDGAAKAKKELEKLAYSDEIQIDLGSGSVNSKLLGDVTAAMKQLGGVEKEIKVVNDGLLSIVPTTTQTADAFIKMGNKVKDVMVDMTSSVQSGLQNLIETTADQLGVFIASLINPSIEKPEFGKAILDSLASFANQFGAMLIATGLAAIAFQSVAMNPYLAIAAGVALIAAASATKALLNQSSKGLSSITTPSSSNNTNSLRTVTATVQRNEFKGVLYGKDIYQSNLSTENYYKRIK